MSLSNTSIYQCNEVEELRDFLRDVLSLLHQNISIQDYIDTIADKIKDAIETTHPILTTLVKNHLTHITFDDINDLITKSDQINIQDLAAKMHGYQNYGEIDSCSYFNSILQQVYSLLKDRIKITTRIYFSIVLIAMHFCS